jgi:hypothetical protein
MQEWKESALELIEQNCELKEEAICGYSEEFCEEAHLDQLCIVHQKATDENHSACPAPEAWSMRGT